MRSPHAAPATKVLGQGSQGAYGLGSSLSLLVFECPWPSLGGYGPPGARGLNWRSPPSPYKPQHAMSFTESPSCPAGTQ